MSNANEIAGYTRDAVRTAAPVTHRTLIAMHDNAEDMHALLGLSSEVGELCDAYKKHIFYGTELDRTNVVEEIGDVAWYLALLADSIGYTLEECMARNIAKLRARYPHRFTQADAVSRDLTAERAALEGAIQAGVLDIVNRGCASE